MSKVIVISPTLNKAYNAKELVEQFVEGVKASGAEVQLISLDGRTPQAAYEFGKNIDAVPLKGSPKTRMMPCDKVEERVRKLILVVGKQVLPRRQIIADLGLKQKSRKVFIDNYLKPAYAKGYITFAYPSSPSKPEQAYRLTAGGLDLYTQLHQE